MSVAATLKLTYAEYLALDAASEVKHEFIDGVAYAMAGGTLEHARLSAAIGALLYAMVRPGRGRCRVYSSDARTHVLALGDSYYPDVTVVCGRTETAPQDEHAITNPTLVVEVLSESTERVDRGRKLRAYQSVPSLQHYLLVAQDERQVEHYRRNADGTWTYSRLGSGASLALADLGGSLALDELYEGAADPT